MKNIDAPNKKLKFALFGHGYHLCYLIKLLVTHGFPRPVVITHPKEHHERDRKLLDDPDLYEYVFDVAEEHDVTVMQTDKVNLQSVQDFLTDQKCDIGFSLSCRSIIKEDVINFFNGNIFNIHPTFLPNERGGGTFSWRILNNVKEVSATLHYIDTGIDTGNVVLQKEKLIVTDFPKPYDYMVETNILYKILLNAFIDDLPNILETDGIRQVESESTYLPRLITETNGAIDWTINGVFIERTIRAFSNPYPGAFTYIKGTKISIMESYFEENNHGMHPLMYGKIIKHTEEGASKAVVKDGYLYVTKIKDCYGEVHIPSGMISHPGQFYTPINLVEIAKYTTNKISKVKLEN